jgi:putative transposase
MPWRQTCQMDQRTQFIARVLAGGDEMTALCREYWISRKTGYKWLGRYRREGAAGLMERSHAPVQHGQAHDIAVVQAVLGLRERWRHWGPKKLRVKLSELHPELAVPAASTIGDWLRREGLVGRSRRRHCPKPFATVAVANNMWCTDFKGWFGTADGRRCDPFTLSDAHSRYLLRCQAVPHPDEQSVRPIFEAAFQEHGLPRAIRSDNGLPFASTGVGGLSRLAIWWIKLGIRPARILAGKPQQNGRHERVHRTLNQETARPPTDSLPAQQRRFDDFRAVYNNERPHEALGPKTPASLYQPSPRPYPERVDDPS